MHTPFAAFEVLFKSMEKVLEENKKIPAKSPISAPPAAAQTIPLSPKYSITSLPVAKPAPITAPI